MTQDSNPYADTFRQEAEELLADIEDSILDVEQNPEDADAVNRLFRAMHTIKGSGSMFGFDDVAAFTHHVETCLDMVRSGELAITRELIDLILASRDQIKAMLDAERADSEDDQQMRTEIVQGLQALVGAENAPESEVQADAPAPEKLSATYRVRFVPSLGLFATGMDPALLVEDLAELGDCNVTVFTDRLPNLADMDAQQCYLSWDFILETDKGEDAIRDVFLFVEDDCELSVKIISRKDENDDDDDVPRLGEIMINRGDVKAEELENVVNRQKRLGEMLIDSGVATPEKVKAALNEQEAIKKQKTAGRDGTVRVPSDKLDNLINLVGELVITQAQLTQISGTIEAAELGRPVEEVERLTAELRDSVLNMRMMPIGTTFNRFRRLVRDLSLELGKEIELETEGADTELDKTVIERLGDPLVHIIRNSVDHGVEQPEQRRDAGKDPAGRIHLAAQHKGANVIITIQDDGKGLDVDAIREKATRQGLIAADAELSDKDIFGLIFQPGFSTAAAVTSVSGRGVGMDVVKREIDALGGSIDVNSAKGKGTTIALSLPLTLAIIDGLLVDVAGDRYVIPVSMVEECLELTNDCQVLDSKRHVIRVRDELVPYVRLREIFSIDLREPEIEEAVIVNVNGMRIGAVVDRIIGDHQTVIKSLGKLYQEVEEISGATIMGNGDVALILDMAGIVRCAEREEAALLV